MAEATADQKDASKLEHQAHDEHRQGKHAGGIVKQTESKLGKHRDLIIVSISLLSLIIAFAQWKGHAAKKAAAAAASTAGDAVSGTSTDSSSVDPAAAGYLPTTGSGAPMAGYVDGSSGSGASSTDITAALTQALGQQQTAITTAMQQAQAGQSAYLTNLTHELAVLNGSVKANTTATQRSTLPPKFVTPVRIVPAPKRKIQPVKKKPPLRPIKKK
jgi:hypothetical protein